MPKVVSANNLVTGAVVFLAADGTWVAALDEAAPFADVATAEAALARTDQTRDVVDPFVVDRKDGIDGPASMSLRNAIRAFGPTIDYLPAKRPDAA